MLALSLSDKFCCFGIFVFVFIFNRFLFFHFSFVLVCIIFFVLVLVFVNENHTGGRWLLRRTFVVKAIRRRLLLLLKPPYCDYRNSASRIQVYRSLASRHHDEVGWTDTAAANDVGILEWCGRPADRRRSG